MLQHGSRIALRVSGMRCVEDIPIHLIPAAAAELRRAGTQVRSGVLHGRHYFSMRSAAAGRYSAVNTSSGFGRFLNS